MSGSMMELSNSQSKEVDLARSSGFEEHGTSLYLALVEIGGGGGGLMADSIMVGWVGKRTVGNTKRKSQESEEKCQSPVRTHSRDNSSRLVRTTLVSSHPNQP